MREYRELLQRTVTEYEPQLVLVSPHSSALQTALVACEDCGAPIIVQMELQNFKAPAKLKHHGLSKKEIALALSRAHSFHAASMVDLSMLPESWCSFGPESTVPSLSEREATLKKWSESWLYGRSETRVLVVTHAPLLHMLLQVKVDNGQTVLVRLSSRGSQGGFYKIPHPLSLAQESGWSRIRERLYGPGLWAHWSDSDDFEEVESKPKALLCVRHVQDETFPVKEGRTCSARFMDWHSESWREENKSGAGCRDPCLTELGILAATSGLPDEQRYALNEIGYGGIPGGLWSVCVPFAIDAVVHAVVQLFTF